MKVGEELINTLKDQVSKIAADSTLTAIERKVKIALLLSGNYSGPNGDIKVYRSPDNRTLLAAEGLYLGEPFHTINIDPLKVLTAIKNIQ